MCGKKTAQAPPISSTVWLYKWQKPTPLDALPAEMAVFYPARDEEFDPVLQGLNALAKAIAPLDAEAALSILDKIVAAANKSKMNTDLGWTGLDLPTFRTMAGIGESRVWQAGFSFNDRLRRILTRTAGCQWKAGKLKKQSNL